MTGSFRVTLCHIGALLALAAASSDAQGSPSDLSLSTAFTYRGRLEERGTAAEGNFDVSFELFDQAVGGDLPWPRRPIRRRRRGRCAGR